MPPKKKFWSNIAQLSDILQILSFQPFILGISALLGVFSQRVPLISALGEFGISCVALSVYFILSACKWLQTNSKKRRGSATQGNDSILSKVVGWCWWKYVKFAVVFFLFFAAYYFVDFRPPIPAGTSLSHIKLPVASYREMRQQKITGRTVVFTALPRDAIHRMLVEGKTFEKCDIIGPAVIYAYGDCAFEQSRFGTPDGRVESILFELNSSKTATGMYGMKNCIFIQCNITAISFVEPSEIYQKIKDQTPSVNENL